jgi:hypothetical protein
MKTLAKILSSRWFQFTAIPLAVLIWFLVTDPSGGADTVLRVQLWAQALLVTGLAYLIAKAMLGNASSEALYAKVLRGSTAAGIAYLGICLLRALVLIGLLVFFGAVQ